MPTRPTQLRDVRAHFHTVPMLRDIPNAGLAVLAASLAAARDRRATFAIGVPACTPAADGRVIAERATIVSARGAA